LKAEAPLEGAQQREKRKVSSRRPVVNWRKAEEKGRSETLFIRELPPGQSR